MTCDAVIPIQRGTHIVIRFVGRDCVGDTIDLDPTDRFFLTAAWRDGEAVYDTVDNPTALYVEQAVQFDPCEGESFVADCVTLDLTPEQSRLLPPGNLTRWEIERWALGDDAEQEHWGSGRFDNRGGLNPDE